jgi:hypothetical protein
MNDSLEFTPKEKYLISLWKDPAGLFNKTIARRMCFLIPSLALAGYFIYSGEVAYGLLAYGILVYRAVYSLVILRRGLQSICSIVSKYETRLQKETGA